MYLIKKAYPRLQNILHILENKKKKKKAVFKQIDWKKVKENIETRKGNLESVSVGLAEDWFSTADEVWNKIDGYIPKENMYAFTYSSWATPSIELIYKDGGEHTFECWVKGNNLDSYFNL
jgi:hypothetical protein